MHSQNKNKQLVAHIPHVTALVIKWPSTKNGWRSLIFEALSARGAYPTIHGFWQ
jgi:hypothetical protein